MGCDIPKQFLEIKGKPILAYSLETFSHCKEIDEIVLVINEKYRNEYEKIAHGCGAFEKISFVVGGETRQESVKNAVEKVSQNQEEAIILVHDAARPFISERIILDNIEAVKKSRCCTTAVKSSNSVYLTEDGRFVNELDRKSIYIAQTPQSAFLSIFNKAYAKITETYTDEAGLFSALGYIPHIVQGEERNKKITFKEDLWFPSLHNRVRCVSLYGNKAKLWDDS